MGNMVFRCSLGIWFTGSTFLMYLLALFMWMILLILIHCLRISSNIKVFPVTCSMVGADTASLQAEASWLEVGAGYIGLCASWPSCTIFAQGFFTVVWSFWWWSPRPFAFRPCILEQEACPLGVGM